jgi:hypothetical protein
LKATFLRKHLKKYLWIPPSVLRKVQQNQTLLESDLESYKSKKEKIDHFSIHTSISEKFSIGLRNLPHTYIQIEPYTESHFYFAGNIAVSADLKVITNLLPHTINGLLQGYTIRWSSYLRILFNSFFTGTK